MLSSVLSAVVAPTGVENVIAITYIVGMFVKKIPVKAAELSTLLGPLGVLMLSPVTLT